MAKKMPVSIYDYPEHLNPFHENDHKMHFWNITKKFRRNSLSDGFKELRRTWSFRTLTKKGRRDSGAGDSSSASVGGEPESPIMYRSPLRASTMSRSSKSPEETNRYLYGGSLTPLPRFRFQERGSLSDQKQLNGETPSPVISRRTSTPVGSPSVKTPDNSMTDNDGSHNGSLINPFETPVPAVRSSTRKKRRAPLPPIMMNKTCDTPSIVITDTSVNTTIIEEVKTSDEIDIDDPSLNIELKIVEDCDTKILKEENNQEQTTEVEEKPNIVPMNDTTSNELDKEHIETMQITNDIKQNDLKTDEQNSNKEKCADNIESDSAKKENESTEKKSEEIEVIKNDLCIEEINDTISNGEIRSETEKLLSDEKDEVDLDNVTQIPLHVDTDDNGDDDVFKKVDINAYKKQQSDIKVDEEQNKNIENAVEEKNGKEQNGALNDDSIESKDIIKENARRRSEFFELDKNSLESENIEIREKPSENINYQRKRVSDMKLLFDNPNVNDPLLINPIPKPRRIKSTTKVESNGTSPIEI